ncbi:unnamed protein product, partial [Strongylus vulgaris]
QTEKTAVKTVDEEGPVKDKGKLEKQHLIETETKQKQKENVVPQPEEKILTEAPKQALEKRLASQQTSQPGVEKKLADTSQKSQKASKPDFGKEREEDLMPALFSRRSEADLFKEQPLKDIKKSPEEVLQNPQEIGKEVP